MRAIALLPAAALLAGTASALLDPDGTAWRVVLLAAAWVVASASWVAGRGAVCVAAALAGFFAVGGLLGGRSERDARRPELRDALRPELEQDVRWRPPVYLAGVLRVDGTRTPYGASLLVDVDRVERDTAAALTTGRVSLAVGGSLAGAAIGDWRAGRRVRVPAIVRRAQRFLNPGVPDQELALARRGIALFGSVKSGALVEVIARGPPASEAAAAVRRAVRAALDDTVRPWSARSAAIVAAILVGDRTGLDADTEDRLQRAGTYHVIAISGGNVALFAGLLVGACGLLGTSPRCAAIVTAMGVAAYGDIVAGGASVGRAVCMALLVLAARAMDLRTAAFNALGVAAGLELAVRPLAIHDAGFALSYGATVGILLGASALAGRVGDRFATRAPRVGRTALTRAALGIGAATVAAELALLPVAAASFSRVTVAGLVLNLAAIPLMGAAEMAGLAAVVTTWLHAAPVSRALGFTAHLAAYGLVESAGVVDLVPWASPRVPAPSPLVVATYYAGCAACYLGRPGGRTRRLSAGVVVIAVGWIIVAPTLAIADWGSSSGLDGGPLRRPLSVIFLDVGQGDATLVRFPGGEAWLVDAGGLVGSSFDVGRRVVVPALWALGVRRLDRLVLTHGDPNHIGGALAVLDDLRPREVLEGIPVPGHEPLARVRARARALGIAWRQVLAPTQFALGDVRCQLVHPTAPEWARRVVRNDDSIVLDVRLGEVSTLLPGDVEARAERALAGRLVAAPVTILKVPHHGSATSSTAPFVSALAPALAVVSAGRENRFGHPAPQVIERYARAGTLVFRTDRDGAVMLETDGRTVRVRTMTGRAAALTIPPLGEPRYTARGK